MSIFIHPSLAPTFRETPITLIDAGASGGIVTHWKVAEPHLKVVGFEPDHRAFAALPQTGRQVFFNVAVSDTTGTQKLYLTRKQTVSSLLKPNLALLDRFGVSPLYDIVGEVDMAVDTVDNVLEQNGIKDPDFIKVDTQGTELPVLRGAARQLEHSLIGVEVEVSFVETYEGQELFPRVHDFLSGLGYEIFDMKRGFWQRKTGAGMSWVVNRGQMTGSEVIYFKNLDAIQRWMEANPDRSHRRSKLLRMASTCALYGRWDYALEVLACWESCFEPGELALIRTAVQQQTRAMLRLPRGGRRVSNMFAGFGRGMKWLGDFVNPTYTRSGGDIW